MRTKQYVFDGAIVRINGPVAVISQTDDYQFIYPIAIPEYYSAKDILVDYTKGKRFNHFTFNILYEDQIGIVLCSVDNSGTHVVHTTHGRYSTRDKLCGFTPSGIFTPDGINALGDNIHYRLGLTGDNELVSLHVGISTRDTFHFSHERK